MTSQQYRGGYESVAAARPSRDHLTEIVDRINAEHAATMRRYPAIVRLSLLLQRVHGGNAVSIGDGLLTALLLMRAVPDYANALLDERLAGQPLTEENEAQLRQYAALCPTRETPA